MVKKLTTILFLLLVKIGYAQVDTITKAAAWTNSFVSTVIYGRANNGHYYNIGLNNRYDASGNPIEMQVTRTDLQTGVTTYKILTSSFSSPSALVSWSYDSAYNIYMGLTSGNQVVWKFNFKDSIVATNLGNMFQSSGTYAYTQGMGTDYNMYFGAAGGDPYYSYYNPNTNTSRQYSPIQRIGVDYVLTITGDSAYIYLQTGQRDSINIWVIKKSDSTTRNLFKIGSGSRFSLETACDNFVYIHSPAYANDVWFKMVNGDTVRQSGWPLCRLSTEFAQANCGGCPVSPVPTITNAYNRATSTLNYNFNDSLGSASVAATQQRNLIRYIFFDSTDTDKFYYVGDYYGDYYTYSYMADTGIVLGNLGYNIYSEAQFNDSTFYIGGYPSGFLSHYNKNEAWTVGTYNGSILIPISDTTNPKLEGYFRSNTPAGFHHLVDMVFDSINHKLICGGDLERTALSYSVGTYDETLDTLIGYDYTNIDTLCSLRGLTQYENRFLVTGSNVYGGTPKIYWYNTSGNTMTDSFTSSYADYGQIFAIGNKGVAIAQDRIYTINLKAKRIIDTYVLPAGTITGWGQYPDGRIWIYTGGTQSVFNAIPTNIWDFVYSTVQGKQPFNTYMYQVYNQNIIRYSNEYRSNINVQTPEGRLKFLRRKFGIE